MKKFFISMALFLLAGTAGAQNYFPMEVDNRYLYWNEYTSDGNDHNSYSLRWNGIISDTIFEGERFFIFHFFPGDPYFTGTYRNMPLRYDSTDQKIYVLLIDSVMTYMDFNLNDGDTLVQYYPYWDGNIRVVRERIIEPFGDTVMMKGVARNEYVYEDQWLYGDKYGLLWFQKVPVSGLHTYRLIETVQEGDSMIYYTNGYLPQLDITMPDTMASYQYYLEFICDHYYSVKSYSTTWWSISGMTYIDRVEFHSCYVNGNDTITNEVLLANEVSEIDYDIVLNFDQQLISNGYQYYYRFIAYDRALVPQSTAYPQEGYNTIVFALTDISDSETVPEEFGLTQNYPNPFNPSTSISYSLPERSGVRLSVLNTLGEEIAVLVNQVKLAGSYVEKFNAGGLPSGVYFYRLQAGDFVATKKMLLLK